MQIPDLRTPTRALAGAWFFVILASLLGTMFLGVYLRWVLAQAWEPPIPFGHLRHAHSHLGYFGLLFPLSWLGWKAAGARVPGISALWIYAGFTALATVGFMQKGYGPIAIAGCTAVSAFWLWSAFYLWKRMGDPYDLLAGIPLGLVASLACVPPIAIYLRSDPEFAQAMVSTFLSSLLLVVVIPSTLAGRKIHAGPWPLFLGAGILGSLCLGVAPLLWTRAGLVIYAILLGRGGLKSSLPTHLRLCWLAVALGLAAMAFGVLPNHRPVALGAIHFLILGPVLGSLASEFLPRNPPDGQWYLGHASWGLMSAALVSQAFVGDPRTWTLAAIGGSATLLWWIVVLLRQYPHFARDHESAHRKSQLPNKINKEEHSRPARRSGR